MTNYIQTILLLCLAISLTGCNEKRSYNYFLQHPFELKKTIEQCQASDKLTSEVIEECDVAMKAAQKMMEILNEQQANPEKFGEKILAVETACVKAKTELTKVQQVLADLKAKNASPADMTAAEEKVKLAEQNYQNVREENKNMLAVVSLNSPE